MFFTGDPSTRKRVDLGGRSSKERDRQKLLEQTRLERNRRLWVRQQNSAALKIQVSSSSSYFLISESWFFCFRIWLIVFPWMIKLSIRAIFFFFEFCGKNVVILSFSIINCKKSEAQVLNTGCWSIKKTKKRWSNW